MLNAKERKGLQSDRVGDTLLIQDGQKRLHWGDNT